MTSFFINRLKYLLITLVSLLVSSMLHAQKLDAIGKEEPLTVSGSISTNFIYYGTTGVGYGREPFTSYINGALNFDIYGVAMPFSFSYSSQATGAFQQPFNQVAFHPAYKWVTAHIGFTSMNFSSHSLSGHTFAGVGVDLTPPGRFKISAMFGRLLRPVAAPGSVVPDVPQPDIVPSYARWGGGVKVGYAFDKHTVDLILFKAKDDAASIPVPDDSYNVRPKDNLIVGVNLSSRITSKLALQVEATASGLTNNTRLLKDTVGRRSLPDMGFLLKANGSTVLYKALKTGLSYSIGRSNIGVGYERIDPEYQSLGAYYTTNDLENITMNLGTSLLNGKMQFAFNVGKQRDNLNNSKASAFTNWVYAGNAGYTPNDKLSLNISYSNFQAYTHIRSAYQESVKLTPYDRLDTLRFTQISQNMGVNATYKLSADNQRVQMVSLSVNGMLTKEMQGDSTTAGNGGIYNGTLSYSLSLVPVKTTLNIGTSMSVNDIALSKSYMIGPVLGLARGFLDGRLNTGVGINYSLLKAKGQTAGSVLSTRLGVTYGVGGKKEDKGVFNHQLGLSALYSNRFKSTSTAKAFADFTVTFSYTCNLLPQKYWLGMRRKGK